MVGSFTFCSVKPDLFLTGSQFDLDVISARVAEMLERDNYADLTESVAVSLAPTELLLS
jgi:hypothetical protein